MELFVILLKLILGIFFLVIFYRRIYPSFLLWRLSKMNEHRTTEVALTLGLLARRNNRIVLSLLKIIQSMDTIDSVKSHAIYAIRIMGSKKKEKAKIAVPILIECIRRRGSDSASSAASTLGDLGKFALPAVEVLQETLLDSDDVVLCEEIKIALEKISPHSIFEAYNQYSCKKINKRPFTTN